MRTKRSRSTSLSDNDLDAGPALPTTSSQELLLHDSPRKSKKLKLQSSYSAASPFPEFEQPTPVEALEVFELLSSAHRNNEPPLRMRKSPSASSSLEVPNVIEALIDTILSQNTTAQNSTRAKRGLDDAFGRNNFADIASAPQPDLVDAIRCGGLANKKAATIQKILKSIKLLHGEYSLQHLAASDKGERMSDKDIMQELVAFDGVGPKTASCVLLFCLGRDSFAVDTHVFRLSQVLGWVPAKANRITTQAHLDLRVPNELKYGLHVLMVQHGRVCKGCKKPGSRKSCVLKSYLKDRKSSNPTSGEVKLEVKSEHDGDRNA